MNNRRSLQLLAEQYNQVQTNQVLRDAFERDLKAFEQYIINEGLWDTIKQKGSQLVGGAKNALIQPLIKIVLDKLAQSDPEGYKKLQAAANDPAQLQALLNSPEVQQQQQAVGQDVATTTESVDEELYEEYLNEAYAHLVGEAPRVLSTDPRNIRRRELAAQRRATKTAPSTPQGPGTTLNTGQHGSTAAYAAANGGKVSSRVPQQSTAVKAIGKAGDVINWAGNKIATGKEKLGQTQVGQAVKSAAGGFIGKAVNWVKAHPKISLASALGLLVATGGAAAVGAGGIGPLISSTIAAGGVGAAKGGIIGSVVGGAKDIYNQVKSGDVKNLGDIKWGQAGKAALKTGVKGAAIGTAAAAGGNVLGKAVAGLGKVFGHGATTHASTGAAGGNTLPPNFDANVNDQIDRIIDSGNFHPRHFNGTGVKSIDQLALAYNKALELAANDPEAAKAMLHKAITSGNALDNYNTITNWTHNGADPTDFLSDLSPNDQYNQPTTPGRIKPSINSVLGQKMADMENQTIAAGDAADALKRANWNDRLDKLYPQYRTQVRR